MEEVEVGLLEGGIRWLGETILENLDTDKLDAWIRQVGLAGDTKKLRSEVERVDAVVADVKGRAVGNRSLARSLGRLRELLYDADDVVDDLDYYRLHQHVQGGGESCGEWQRLSLERLSMLTKLVLIKMRNAKEVSIPSLEELVLIKLPSLNTCSCTSVRNLNDNLKVLKIMGCPALKQACIYDCPLLCVHNPLPPSSKISKLSIRNVSTLPTVEGSLRNKLTIGVPGKDIFDEDSDQLITLDEEVLSFHNLSFLTTLVISGCQNLMTISLKGLRQLVCLKSLEIHHCPDLLSSNVPSELTRENMSGANRGALPSHEHLHIEDCGITGKWLSLMLQHVALKELILDYCNQITGLSVGEEENSQPSLMSSLEDPSLGYPGRDELLCVSLNLMSSLKKLSIICCFTLTFYRSNQGFAGFTSLEELHLQGCPRLLSSLAHIDRNDDQSNGRCLLPLSLGELQIREVDPLKALQPCFLGNLTRLKKLEISRNPSLTSLQLHSCTALQELIIKNCESLNSLEGLQSLKNLKVLHAHRCLSGHGEDGRCILPQSLEELCIIEYSQETLQPCFPDNLTSLKKLRLFKSPRLTSLQLHSCTVLQELMIQNCELLNFLEGLQSLKNLKVLHTQRFLGGRGEDGRCILSQSLEELYINKYSKETPQPCFPSNLTCLKRLEASNTSSLKYLALESCTALEELTVTYCQSLATIGGLQTHRSIRQLKVCGCPCLPAGLESLSSQGYEPCPGLERLEIDDPSVLTTSFCKHLTSLQRLGLSWCKSESGKTNGWAR
uniref:Disease resistance N-terminal domain-containing protein n=1 Tax=Oryza brachyantha TaxID=4533 RepID=J3M1J2_ORYBR